MNNTLKTYWLSFSGDEGFRGVVVAQGKDFDDALTNAWLMKCNPGGEVMGLELPPESEKTVLERYKPFTLPKKEDIKDAVGFENEDELREFLDHKTEE